jgi:hypothetical protein
MSILCRLGFHKWNFRAIIDVDYFKVFVKESNTLEVKRCIHCRKWNIPVQCLGLSNSDIAKLEEKSNVT